MNANQRLRQAGVIGLHPRIFPLVALVVEVLACAPSVVVHAQTASVDEARTPVQQRPQTAATDWSKAPLTEARAAAEQGEVSAQFYLGRICELGVRVPQDYALAAHYYRLAAEQGHAMAQNNLGNLLQQGLGVPRDASEAVKWFRRSAEQGEAYGQANLGWTYYSGRGLAKNREQAEYWFRKAADQGFAYAQYMMGQLARRQKELLGNTIVGNYQVASEWYEKAAAQGHTKAMYELGDLYLFGKLGYNHPKAAEWFRKAAQQGDLDAAMQLGNLYAVNHSDLPADPDEAARWYQLVAEKGNAEAQYKLGCLLADREDVPEHDEAERWLEQAAASGYVEASVKLAALRNQPLESVLETHSREELEVASYNAGGETRLILAKAYEEGRGGAVDLSKAAETYWRILNLGPRQDEAEALRRLIGLYFEGKLHFEDAAIYGPKDSEAFAKRVRGYSRLMTDPETQFQVGEMFLRGGELPQDKAEAVEWLTRSARGGSAPAMNRLGELWAAGLSGSPDLKEAAAWYEHAATNGLAAAQLNLGRAYREGHGVREDLAEASAWLRLAAEQGSQEAQRALAEIEPKLTPAQLEASKRRADELGASILSTRNRP